MVVGISASIHLRYFDDLGEIWICYALTAIIEPWLGSQRFGLGTDRELIRTACGRGCRRRTETVSNLGGLLAIDLVGRSDGERIRAWVKRYRLCSPPRFSTVSCGR
jgi:hypothetical protein